MKIKTKEQLHEEVAIIAIKSLELYADPSFYHACSFLFDRPTGGFDKDFDKKHGDWLYDRAMPGKDARAALKKCQKMIAKFYKEYPELMTQTNPDDYDEKI